MAKSHRRLSRSDRATMEMGPQFSTSTWFLLVFRMVPDGSGVLHVRKASRLTQQNTHPITKQANSADSPIAEHAVSNANARSPGGPLTGREERWL